MRTLPTYIQHIVDNPCTEIKYCMYIYVPPRQELLIVFLILPKSKEVNTHTLSELGRWACVWAIILLTDMSLRVAWCALAGFYQLLVAHKFLAFELHSWREKKEKKSRLGKSAGGRPQCLTSLHRIMCKISTQTVPAWAPRTLCRYHMW